MRVLSQLLLLSGLLTAACGPAATSETGSKAQATATPTLTPTPPKVAPVPLAAADSLALAELVNPQVADSMRAYWGSRPMRFSTLAATQLSDRGIDAVPGLRRRVWVAQDLYQLPRFYYHPAVDTSEWVTVRLENVGARGTGRNWTLDTVALGPGQPQALLIMMEGRQGFWGGARETRVVELLTLEPQPRLLLKSEARWANLSYGRKSEEEYDEDARVEQRREQTISIRSGVVRVSPIQVVDRSGSVEETQTLRTVPMTMVPPGQYRYQGGRLVRIGR